MASATDWSVRHADYLPKTSDPALCRNHQLDPDCHFSDRLDIPDHLYQVQQENLFQNYLLELSNNWRQISIFQITGLP